MSASKRTARPCLEALEDRTPLAGSLGVALDHGGGDYRSTVEVLRAPLSILSSPRSAGGVGVLTAGDEIPAILRLS
jgi:hypothetical protein